jgi:DNA-binding transcriptional LysR family regulator
VKVKTTEADLNDIQVFVKVVDQGSFTAAARSLFLPKSSVSRKVARLEDRLGLRLLQRTTRSLTLTSAGRTYFERVSRLMADLEDVESTLAGYAQAPKGPLRVTGPVSIVDNAPTLFADFLLAHPEVLLSLEITDRMVNMVEEGFDLALRGGRPPDASLSGKQILATGLLMVASTHYLETYGRPSKPTDLKEHRCLILGKKNHTNWEFKTPRGMVQVPVHGPLACTNVRTLLEAARRGLGIARVPVSGVTHGCSGLERVMPEQEGAGGGLWVVLPSGRHLSPAVRAFIEFLEGYDFS